MKKDGKVLAAWSTDGRITALVKATNGRSVRKRIFSASDLKKTLEHSLQYSHALH